MLRLRPFRAWRPDARLADRFTCVPYDVIDTDEARALAGDNPHSFLRVIRPEIAFGPDTDPHADAVYAEGRARLDAFMAAGVLVRDREPHTYIYRIRQGSHSQTGLFTLVSTDDYDAGRIVRHEATRPDKEDDRTRHILTQGAHAEPVLLVAPRLPGFAEALEAGTLGEPLYDLTTEDQVRHTLWVAPSDLPRRMLTQAGRLYVADGHHRCKAASRVARELGGTDPDADFRFFPAVVFPQEQLRILPYNRLLTGVTDAQWSAFLAACPVVAEGPAIPGNRGLACVYRAGRWTLHELPAPADDAADRQLDVARLQDGILAPIFGITDPRTHPRIAFVGGSRGTAELERKVDSGAADLAFSLHPTSIADLVSVSDAGLLMPPKSTWFEPKLRSGLLIADFSNR